MTKAKHRCRAAFPGASLPASAAYYHLTPKPATAPEWIEVELQCGKRVEWRVANVVGDEAALPLRSAAAAAQQGAAFVGILRDHLHGERVLRACPVFDRSRLVGLLAHTTARVHRAVVGAPGRARHADAGRGAVPAQLTPPGAGTAGSVRRSTALGRCTAGGTRARTAHARDLADLDALPAHGARGVGRVGAHR